MMWLSFALRYKHLIGYGIAVLSLAALVWYIHNEGYKACKNDIIVEHVEVLKKRNEIVNRPLDDDAFLDSLWTHDSDWR